jgi:hypothetical protein
LYRDSLPKLHQPIQLERLDPVLNQTAPPKTRLPYSRRVGLHDPAKFFFRHTDSILVNSAMPVLRGPGVFLCAWKQVVTSLQCRLLVRSCRYWVYVSRVHRLTASVHSSSLSVAVAGPSSRGRRRVRSSFTSYTTSRPVNRSSVLLLVLPLSLNAVTRAPQPFPRSLCRSGTTTSHACNTPTRWRLRQS